MENRKFRDSNGDIHWLIEGEPQKDWVEIIDEQFIPDPNYVIPYGFSRMNNYPTIGNQLDMLWHELNTSGSISTDGTWFQSIQQVKQQYPKS
jgi:hypothetical protein